MGEDIITMNAAQCASHPTFIGSVLEKCYRISPDGHYTMLAAGSHRRWIPAGNIV